MGGSYDVVIRERESVTPRGEVVNSWAPKKPSASPKAGETFREALRSLASWVALVALAIDVLAAIFEPIELLRHGAPVTAAIAAILASFGLSMAFALVAAVPIAGVYTAVRYLGRLRRPLNYSWPIPLAVLGWLVVGNFAPRPVAMLATKAQAQWALCGLLVVLLVVATFVARFERTAFRVGFGMMLAALMLVLSYALPPSIHHEPRDIVWFCLVVCVLAILYPLRRAMREAEYVRVMRGLGGLVLISSILGVSAPLVSPNFRVYARDYGAFYERMGRLLRELADLDGDGFSAVFGGIDCDDLDASRNPAMVEKTVGQDRNCNGIRRPASFTPADLGLAPEVGDPDAAPGTIDRVVVVTFDCFRFDAFTPAVTPNLAGLATRGVTLGKLYAAGSRTALALPLMLRGNYDRRPLAAILHDLGVSSTVVFGYRHGSLEGNVLDGFETVQRPPGRDKRFRATEVTDLGLADLRDPAHARDHFLWTHFFDAHGPRSAKVLPSEVPRHGPIAGEGADSALYLDELAYDDRELGRLLEGLAETGDMSKTLLIVTADHGEGFGAHNMYEHGQSTFDEIIHVPGVIVGPGFPPGGRYDHVVSHRDVLATVLGAFGFASKTPRSEEFGRSWLRLRGAAGAPLHTFVTTYSASAHVFAWADAPMMSRTDDDAKLSVGYLSGLERLYHLSSKEKETRDVDPYFGDEAVRDRRELELYRDIDRPPP